MCSVPGIQGWECKKKKTQKTVFDQPLVESTNMKGADIKGQLYLLGNTKNKKRV